MKAVITGASSGIGKAYAYELASRDYSLIIAARREVLLKEVKADIEAKYPKVKVTIKVIDLADHQANEMFIKELANEKIDLFINNAGFGYFGNTIEQDPARTRNMIDLMITTLTYYTQVVGAQMAKAGGGIILNISSIGAYNSPFPGNNVYAAAKKYVWDFSRAANYENKQLANNVRVVSIQPGAIESEWRDMALNKVEAKAKTAAAPSGPRLKQTPAPIFARRTLNKVFETTKDSITSGKFGYSSKMQGKLPRFMKMNMLYKLSKSFGDFGKK